MAESSHAEAGMRFASDLRGIREHKDITVEELHDETKIPIGLIESFEHTGLFDHPMFNRVYLRSFVRTYAQVVGIPTETALAQLDEALEGRYVDQLAREYLPGRQHHPEPVPERGASGPAVSPEQDTAQEPSRIVPEDEPVNVPGPEASTEGILPPVSEQNVAGPGQPAAPIEERPTVPEEALPPQEQPSPALTTKSAEVDLREHADVPTAARVFPPASAPRPPVERPQRSRPMERAAPEEESNRSRLYAGIGIAVVAIVAAFLLWGRGSSQRGVTAPGSDEVAAVDSQAVADSAGATAVSPVVLGDTMHVTVVAANGPVQNLKVTVDDDLRRPYWIENGQSRTFTPTQRIIIERQIPKIQLQVEGEQYPTAHVDDQGRIVITRDSALQYVSNPG